MGHALGYARVSTGDQNLAGQRQRLEAAGVYRTFEDVVSGKVFERPGLKQLLGHARPGDILTVMRLDRLGRSMRELIDTMMNLQVRGVGFRSLEEAIDTNSAAGELVFHVFASIAQFERRLIAERTRDGIAAACQRGKVPGRPGIDQEKLSAALLLVRQGRSVSQAATVTGISRSKLYDEVRKSAGAATPATSAGNQP